MSVEEDPVLAEAGRPLSDEDLAEVEHKPKPSTLRNAVEWVVIAGGALLVAFVIKTFLLQAFYIPSLSMAPTLKINDRVLVNKLSYDLHPSTGATWSYSSAPPTRSPTRKT